MVHNMLNKYIFQNYDKILNCFDVSKFSIKQSSLLAVETIRKINKISYEIFPDKIYIITLCF